MIAATAKSAGLLDLTCFGLGIGSTDNLLNLTASSMLCFLRISYSLTKFQDVLTIINLEFNL